MKHTLLILASLAGLSFLISCKQTINLPERDTPSIHPLSIEVNSNAGMSSNGLDTIAVSALLQYDVSNSLESTTSNTFNTVASAAFTNDTIAINIDSVAVNNYLLDLSGTGAYHLYDPISYTSSSTVQWRVRNYLGSDVGDTSTMASPIVITGISVGDTVSKSSGFTISYTGSSSGDLFATARYNDALTANWGDTTIANDTNTTGYYEKAITDGGSVSFSSSDLANFSTNIYITIGLSHWIYHIVTAPNGKNVGIYSRYTTTIPVFLKP